MRSVYIFLLIALLVTIFTNAFPHTSLSSFDYDPSTIVIKSNIQRREQYDPYGFNSILSRFVKRSQSYDINKNKHYSPNKVDIN